MRTCVRAPDTGRAQRGARGGPSAIRNAAEKRAVPAVAAVPNRARGPVSDGREIQGRGVRAQGCKDEAIEPQNAARQALRDWLEARGTDPEAKSC